MECLNGFLCCIPTSPRADSRGNGTHVVNQVLEPEPDQPSSTGADIAIRQELQIDYGPLITSCLNNIIAQPSADSFESLVRLVTNESVNLKFKLGHGNGDPEYTLCDGNDGDETVSLASIIFSGVNPKVLDVLRREYDGGDKTIYDPLYSLIETVSFLSVDHAILDCRGCSWQGGRSMNNTPLLNLVSLSNVLPSSEFNKIDDSLSNVIANLNDGDSAKNTLSHVDNFQGGGHTVFGFLVRQGKHALAWQCLQKGAPVIHPTRPNELIISMLASFGTTGYELDVSFLNDFLEKFLIDIIDITYKMSVDAANIIIRDFWVCLDDDRFYDTSGNKSGGASLLNSYNPSDRRDRLKRDITTQGARTLSVIKNWHCSGAYSEEFRVYLDLLIKEYGQNKLISELEDLDQSSIARHIFSVYKPQLEKTTLGGGTGVFTLHYRSATNSVNATRIRTQFFKDHKNRLFDTCNLLTHILNNVEIDRDLEPRHDFRR